MAAPVIPNNLPRYQRIVTTHNKEGKAIVSDVDTTAPWQTNIEHGKAHFSLGWITNDFPVNTAEGADIQTYKNYLEKPPGIVQNSGSVLRIVDASPGHLSPMHRTVSLDYGVVLFGEIELVLDSGETKIMKQGDVCIQRGTMHAWRNTSKTEWARMMYVLQPCRPIEHDGKSLEEDYGNMPGVRASS
ncbi:hypothetical protein K461DRAFT_293165 [Myriangium duriaei CBS 260.36]|uniref:Cupin type-2 domain-containing protein n=1 Tax=Myriangium duriaei CBS 260.36 TaxID=1168546 RepID=A0A9P4J406_9PEZI|nr:hypothetical protein K461DRAFT_293165 [Myriangium duriaei CBS 260.36]